MKTYTIVIDSNVFAKSFLQEEGRELAKALFRFTSEHEIRILCPDIFLYEVLSIAAQNSFPLGKTREMLASFERAHLSIRPLSEMQLKLAMRMAEDGNEKSGYPSIYDSSYHALALAEQGVFITADKRHVAKVSKYGSVVLLDDWESTLSV